VTTDPTQAPTSPSDARVILDRHPRDLLLRELRLRDATMLVVSSVIGVGIFLTPGSVAELLPHPGVFLAAWLVGGLLSLAGALANAELGAMYPHAGGDYVYLREAYHPLAGFAVGWLTFFVIYAGTIATLAIGTGEALRLFVDVGETGKIAVAVAVTIVCSWINYSSLRSGAQVNNLTAYLKIAGLAAIVVFGFAFGNGAAANLLPLAEGATALPAKSFGLALSPVLFSYLGWNASVYVASEIEDPGRNVPRSLFAGLTICTVLYLLVNALYLYAVPIHSLRGQIRAGELAATALFGQAGGKIAAALVLASIVGCLNATILVGPRVAYAMALDGLFFAGVDRVHAARHTPYLAIVAQAAAAIVLILLLRRFPSVLDYTTFAIVLATMADTTALYALRRKHPDRPRPYRAWGYPALPALYLVANAGIAGSMLLGRPLECAAALAVGSTALPFYFAWSRK
jgi:APA family basic amino acid/polyamine antiporter